MSSKRILALEEIEQEMVFSNPGGRICRISSEQSGWKDEQVFTSEMFPNRVKGILLEKLTKKLRHPAFLFEESSTRQLILQGWYGYNYGPRLIDRICDELFSVGEVCSSRSVGKLDFDQLDQKEENVRYWLSSRCEREHGLYRVINGEVRTCTLFDPDGYEEYYADNVRPIIVVKDIKVEMLS